MISALLVAYFLALGSLALVGVHRLWAFGAARRHATRPCPALGAAPPAVLVQIPLYNEALVAERAIRAAAAMRYPRGRLRLQVLDDSTDRTRALVDRAVEALDPTTPIEVLRRPSREGFKAGALAHGLARRPEAELVAIFDADFVPAPDFLERTVPRLVGDPGLGLVQARWGHLNRDRSLLTRAQAVFLDGHFAVEHAARDAAGHPFNFNGTAGVWRRRAIDEAGGWAADTITEDLDLSYRAQLVGWRFAYLHEVVAPAELPESWAAFRAQQSRWVRGSVQTARKLVRRILSSERLSRGARVDALVHLFNNFAYLWMATLALLLPAALVLREELGWEVPGGRALLSGLDLAMLGAGTTAMVVFYAGALHRTVGGGASRRALDLAFALCLGSGMSLSNAREVLRGLGGGGRVFVRTPKRGAARDGGGYRAAARPGLIALELGFAAYYAGAALYAVRWGVWGALPFLLLYLVGFGAVSSGSLLEAWQARGDASAAPGIGAEVSSSRR